jgi:L-histidine N-alpha-methyltransferase
MADRPPVVDVHLTQEDLKAALRSDVANGLTSDPKELPPKWFYDVRGSQLFDEITRLPEYYQTRAERAILDQHAEFIARFGAADTLVELGSGTSEKTRLLLDAFAATDRFARFIPFDVSEATLRQAAESLSEDYPGITVHAVVGDFERHLDQIPGGGRRLIAFLGGTIGNFAPKARAEFLADLSSGLMPGDGLLLGTDLLKAPHRLVEAYDDEGGVTAEFNRNVLRVVNRELDADFDPHRFSHVARFDPDEEWIEMQLRSEVDHTVEVTALPLTASFGEGEEMRTEISAKFRRADVEAELGAAGLTMGRWWTDSNGDFAVSLSFKD